MSQQHVKFSEILSAVFLIAGTCIGGGMLALPVATGISGFIPSMAVMLICWLTMTATGLMLLEVSLWMKEEVHFVTMVTRVLGPWAKQLCWIVYLFIGYGSVVAYTAAGGYQMIEYLSVFTGLSLSKGWGCVLFILIFGLIVDQGARLVGRVNSILMCGLVGAYFFIIGSGVPKVSSNLLQHQYWPTAIMGIPLFLTAFSYQTMAPSLTPYLKRNAKALKWAVVGGTTLTFVVYFVWECVVLGIVSPAALVEALSKGQSATPAFREAVDGHWIASVVDFFSFFAIVTSFLGIALGLFDFLADGLKLPKVGRGKLILGSLIIIPTLFLAIYFDRIFLIALDATGGFGDTILSGMIPALMVWVGRYRLKLQGELRVPGGKAVLIFVFAFFFLSLLLETLVHLGFISSLYDISDVNVL